MEFRFDANEEFQLSAIAAAVGLFEGHGLVRSQLVVPPGATFHVVPNRLDLPDSLLLANLSKVQAGLSLPTDDALQTLSAEVGTPQGKQTLSFPNFSVEMETGTGKTYVYLRTAHALYERYGMRKFIVVVPSIAVREGVAKTLRVTEKHLRELYGNPPYRFGVYDGANASQVRNFALSDGLEILVMTIDAFKRAETIIRQSKEGQDPPIFQLQAVRPVLILDEPQNMESELSIQALAALNPLFALRYSATHRNPYNVIYRLSPYDAYRQGLVKRIEVASVVEEDNANLPFLRLEEITIQKKTAVARVAVHKLMATGKISERVISLKHVADSDKRPDLAKLTGRAEYRGFIVEEINNGGGFLRFANNVEIKLGETTGAEREAIFEAQIKETIQEHFIKQRRFKPMGIKVLSLFFIDKVDNYAPAAGILRKLFVKAFDEAKQEFPEWTDKEAATVQASYFASKARKGEAAEAVDSSGRTKEDESAFNLIMREKEKLLSFEEPVAFIFSHSALREGWDNPNVFQICTMREVGSETERRQQVGRGVRLPVNQNGDRIRDPQVNVLTVVASEPYKRFVDGLQAEIQREYGEGEAPLPVTNKRERKAIKLRKHYILQPAFKELWERIKHRTRYAVTIDSEKLITEVVADLDQVQVRKPRIVIKKAAMLADPTEDMFEAIVQSGARTAIDLAGRYPLPNLIEIMESLMENTSPPMRLSRKTLISIYKRTTNQQAGLDNPHEFAAAAVAIIKEKLADQLVSGIKYEKDGQWFEQTQFVEEILTWANLVEASEEKEGVGGTHLYDGVIFDSSTVERPFIRDLERRTDVRLYIKLPDWFKVETPIGTYNPDWAVVMDNPENGEPVLYLVRETKGSLDLSKLRPDERRKIACGRGHFKALGIDFRVVTGADQLPGGGA